MFPDFQTELHAANQELAYPGGVSASVPSDPESEGGASPDHALRLWMQEVKSEHSSCLSSRANSVLSLTDTEQERKSEPENGTRLFYIIIIVLLLYCIIIIHFCRSTSLWCGDNDYVQ